MAAESENLTQISPNLGYFHHAHTLKYNKAGGMMQIVHLSEMVG
jgi:hypothetical protein